MRICRSVVVVVVVEVLVAAAAAAGRRSFYATLELICGKRGS